MARRAPPVRPPRRVSVDAAIYLAARLARRQGFPEDAFRDPKWCDLDRAMGDAAAMIRALADEVSGLRDGLYLLACRAEDGLTAADAQARVADLLGVGADELRRMVEAR